MVGQLKQCRILLIELDREDVLAAMPLRRIGAVASQGLFIGVD